jgi:putative phage-type endonuclease
MTLPYIVLTSEANTPEWIGHRKGHLGASEVACVLGLSKWSTPLGLYSDKLSPALDDHMDERQEWGHRLEPAIAQWIADTQNITVLPSPGLLRSVEFPWLGATPDRVTDKGEPVELKNSDFFMAKEWEDGVPDNYMIQVLVQMIVLGAKRGYLGVLHGGNRPEFFPIEWDQGIVDQIIRITKAFWYDHIVAKVAPEPLTSSEAVLAFPTAPDTAIEGGEALWEAWGAYGLLQAERKEIDNQLEAMDLQFKKAMGSEATSLTYADPLRPEPVTLFTWKTRKGSTRFDAARFKAEHPDLHADYLKTGEPTRTFTRKTVKEIE